MISVCIATYNGEKYIKEQIESIMKQIDIEDEIIISDDGSKDNTLGIIREINDNRIKIYSNNGKRGFTENFENALSKAKGDYIFLSDQDDIWLPEKVEKTVAYLQDYDLVISDCKTIDQNLRIISESRFDDFSIKGNAIEHFLKSRYIGCCMAMKKIVLEACLPFPKNTFLLEHDIWIAAVGHTYFKTYLLREPLILYRRHGNNVSSGGFTKGYSLKIKLEKRTYRIASLIKICKKVSTLKRKRG